MSEPSVLTPFSKKLATAPARAEADGETIENFGPFHFLRGIRDRSIMLQLCRKDGDIVALSYGLLDRADFNPSVGITLKFGAQRVKIMGRNLNAEVRPHVRLFEGIVRHRVTLVREMDEPTFMAADRQAVVVSGFQFE